MDFNAKLFYYRRPKSIEKKDGGEKLQFFINFNDRFDSGGQYLLSKDGLGFLKVQQQQSLPKEMMLCSSVILTNIAFHFSSSSKGDLPQGKLW